MTPFFTAAASGEILKVELNGEMYEAEYLWTDRYTMGLGNYNICSSNSNDNGLPFFIGHFTYNGDPNDGMSQTLSLNTREPGIYNVKIFRSAIVTKLKQLDKKFIPNLGVDWNENDENTSGYINNRPFYEYEEVKETILNTTIDFSDCYSLNWGQTKVGYIYEGYILSSLVVGQEYNVIFDGTKYSCTAIAENEYGNIIIGNGAHVGNSNEDNGLPFVIGTYNQGDTYTYVISPDQESHTIKVVIPGIGIKKLDKKFIPNLGIDWNENDKDSSKYISNRPFYEYYDGEPIYAIDKSVITFSRGRATNQISTQHRLIEGETYIVIFDDKEYSCVARRINEQYDSLYLGSQ